MTRLRPQFFLAWITTLALASYASSQTITGSNLSSHSSGGGTGNWTLNEDGYVGTYFSLAAPGSVTLTANASGTTTDGVQPHMNIVVADTKAGFDVGSSSTDYSHTFNLPAGTYFVRTEFNNDVSTADRQLTIGSLTVSGATVSNTTTTATNDANALAAADTYIANYRQGPAKIALSGLPAGAQVQVKMVRNAFNFGTYVQGLDASTFLAPVAPGDTTSTAYHYQNFVSSHFNIVVPSNMGKWDSTEATQNVPTMGNVDTILNYAQSHNLDVRMHNLIWGAQQPTWVNTLLTNAQSSNPAVSGPAKTSLMTAISNRIAYYVGDGDADTHDGDRSQHYQELDVLNEMLRNQTYYKVFGYSGIAQIHKMVQDAVVAAGANTRLYTNEYNVLQNSNDPFTTTVQDPYANWYRREVESVNSAGFGQVVNGIGVQYNIDARTSGTQVHSAARVAQVMNNLSVTGLPITLTEFAIQPTTNGVTTTAARSSQLYNESLRLLYGTPQATSFLIWEPWPPAASDNTTLVDSNWNLTQSGQAVVNLLNSWTTPTQNLTVGADGSINFNGYYGDYELSVGGHTVPLSLMKGTSAYSIPVAPGDYNGDGTVDAADYTVWRHTLGSTSDLRADGNGDLVVDDADFSVWRSAFGSTYVFGGGASLRAEVPEPASLCQFFFVSLACAFKVLTRSRIRA